MDNKLYCHTFSYVLGCIINNSHTADGPYIGEYELKKDTTSFLDMPKEYVEVYKATIKKRYESYIEFLKAYNGELYTVKKHNLQYMIKLENMEDFLKSSKLQIAGDIPHLVYYYYIVDYSLVLDLLETYRTVVEHLTEYLKTFNIHINPKNYYKLDIDDVVNNFTKTEQLMLKHNEVFNIKRFDLESILNDVFREK